MKENETNIRKCLARYGAQVRAWPQELQALGHKAEKMPEFAVLFEDEKRFERLLQYSSVPPFRSDLAQRIIAAACTKAQFTETSGWLYDGITQIRPAALAAMVILGFIVGFGALAPNFQSYKQISLQSYSDDEGAIL